MLSSCLVLSLSFKWPIHHIDINNGFLHVDLSKIVDIHQSLGFASSNPSQVFRSIKAIYKLSRTPHSWFNKLSKTLFRMNFIARKSYRSLFTKFNSKLTIFILIYVDDIIITGSFPYVVSSLTSSLHHKFALKDLGPLHYLWYKSYFAQDSIFHLSQTKYINKLIHCANMHEAKP